MSLDKPSPTHRALQAIKTERRRQDLLKAEGRFRFTCADHGLVQPQRLAILMEEVGEVAREVLSLERLVTDGENDWHALRKELCQVAAIACAWLEHVDRVIAEVVDR